MVRLFRVEDENGRGPYMGCGACKVQHVNSFHPPYNRWDVYGYSTRFAMDSLEALKAAFKPHWTKETPVYDMVSEYIVPENQTTVLFDHNGGSRQIVFNIHYAQLVGRRRRKFTFGS